MSSLSSGMNERGIRKIIECSNTRVHVSRSMFPHTKRWWYECFLYLFLCIDFIQDLVENHGYKAPQLCVEAFNKAIQSEEIFPGADKNMKILDAGAGTGMIGEMLVKQGYTNIDALDISQNMLNEAKKKNVYKRLICAPLSDVRIEQIQTAEYDVTLCGGTIVYGQAKPVALDECIRHVRPGQCSTVCFVIINTLKSVLAWRFLAVTQSHNISVTFFFTFKVVCSSSLSEQTLSTQSMVTVPSLMSWRRRENGDLWTGNCESCTPTHMKNASGIVTWSLTKWSKTDFQCIKNRACCYYSCQAQKMIDLKEKCAPETI